MGLRALGDAVTVVAAAWVGLQLPGLSTYVTADHSDDATFSFLSDSSYWAILPPMTLVLLGILLRTSMAQDYDMAGSVYRHAAQPSTTESIMPLPHRGFLTRLRDVF